MKKVLASVAVMALVLPALALDTPHVAGDFQGWDPAANPMTDMGGGVFELTFSGLTPGARQEFKITDGSWDNTTPGSNSWLVVPDSGEVTITYNQNEVLDGWAPAIDRIAVSPDIENWVAAGSFQGWDNANAATAMTPMGGGMYMYNTGALGDGTYYWKAVKSGSWDSVSWDARSINTGDMEFTLDATYTSANLWLDTTIGAVKVELVPEPASFLLLAGLALLRRR